MLKPRAQKLLLKYGGRLDLMRDFTIKKYEELCSVLLKHGYVPFTVFSYLSCSCENEDFDKVVILRHDVDRKAVNALKMAEVENELGIQSTYYFRYPYTFNSVLVKKVSDLGHEVGYHYEVLSKTKGNYEKAITLFEYELGLCREISDVKTICMHGSPLSRYDNRDLWKKYDFKRFGIIGEAYLSVKEVSYFSDTGRSWNLKNKLRDFILGDDVGNLVAVNTTDELIKFIKSRNPKKLYILVHPERWALSNPEWLYGWIMDNLFNAGKKFLRIVKR